MPDFDPLVTYNAKEHPEFEGTGELVISYNVNVGSLTAGSCDVASFLVELGHQVDNYRPRFITVPTP